MFAILHALLLVFNSLVLGLEILGAAYQETNPSFFLLILSLILLIGGIVLWWRRSVILAEELPGTWRSRLRWLLMLPVVLLFAANACLCSILLLMLPEVFCQTKLDPLLARPVEVAFVAFICFVGVTSAALAAPRQRLAVAIITALLTVILARHLTAYWLALLIGALLGVAAVRWGIGSRPACPAAADGPTIDH